MPSSKPSSFELKSGLVDLLLFVVKTTELDTLRVELMRRFEATPEFFANDVVAIDVRRLEGDAQVALPDVVALLESVRMRPVGVVARATQEWAKSAGLPLLEARDRRAAPAKSQPSANSNKSGSGSGSESDSEGESGDVSAPTLVIDRPLRSGQRVYARGDVVVLALVSHGAEVIAEGNIHVYAALRGRALAGVRGNHDTRIFCTCLEAELVSIAGIYRAIEEPLAQQMQGKPVQIRLDGEKLLIEPMRLN
jgi:septum site-determining protein MinC